MNKGEDRIPIDENIVEAVRYEYYHQLGRENQMNNPNPHVEKAVRKAAQLCVDLQCDPAVYVAAQIKFWVPINGHEKQFLPAQLAGPNATDNVNKFRTVQVGNTLQGTYDVQKRYLRQALLHTARSLEDILIDRNMDFDPWFRCLISKAPIPAVIKKWGYEARQQLNSNEVKTFLDGLAMTEGVTFDYSRIPEFKL